MNPTALVVACATLLALAATLPAEAKTFDLQLVVYCPDAATPCGENSEEKLAGKLFNRIDEVNLEWMPTGFWFRPLPIQFKYAAGQRALNPTDSDMYELCLNDAGSLVFDAQVPAGVNLLARTVRLHRPAARSTDKPRHWDVL